MSPDLSTSANDVRIAELFRKAEAAANFNAADAIRFLNEILEAQPENCHAAFEKGTVLASIKDKDAEGIYLDIAVEWFEKAWKLAPENEKDVILSKARRVISQNAIELEKYLSEPMEKSRFGHIDYDRFVDWNTYVEAMLRIAYALKKMSD